MLCNGVHANATKKVCDDHGNDVQCQQTPAGALAHYSTSEQVVSPLWVLLMQLQGVTTAVKQ